ncbi:MAG: Lrp/AsnC family transcriptional regulator [Nitrososphaeria archaeon]|jgi:DNA-binding Lrp family transcriptional regulator
MEFDRIDAAIIESLEENSRTSYIEIGKKVGLSEAAVRRRIKKLLEEGIIRKFTIDVKEEAAHAFTLIAVNPSTPTFEVSKSIKEIKGVKLVYEITGQYDILAFIGGPNITEVNTYVEEIRKTNGVLRTNTVIILKEVT